MKIKLLLLTTMIFWSSAYVGIRIGLIGYTPGALALFRFLIASVCMMFIYPSFLLKQRVAWPHRLQLLLLGMMGIGFYNICLNYGELTVSAGITSFIIGLIPMITVILSICFLHEQPNKTMYWGIAISLCGLLLMAFSEKSHHGIDRGLMILLLSALTGAIYSILIKRYLKRYHPVAVSSWVMWGSMLSLLIFAPTLWKEIPHAPLRASLSAVYIGIFPAALAYVSWSYVLNAMSASKATLFLYTTPILSTLMGYVVLNEQPSIVSLAGGLIALIGSFVASSQQRRQKHLLKTGTVKLFERQAN